MSLGVWGLRPQPPEALTSVTAARYQRIMDDTLALRALAAVIADETLRERFLALTGFDTDTLRARAGEADVLGAVVDFLSRNEADLVRVAGELGVKPGVLMGAHP